MRYRTENHGKEVVREEVEYIPARLSIVCNVRRAYACPKCKHTDYPFIKKVLTPTSLINHSLCFTELSGPCDVREVCQQRPALPVGKGLGDAGRCTVPSDQGQLDDPVFVGLSDAGGLTPANGAA